MQVKQHGFIIKWHFLLKGLKMIEQYRMAECFEIRSNYHSYWASNWRLAIYLM